jgi:S-adenosyl methyltransferase
MELLARREDSYPVDKEMGDQILAYVPELVRSARADRHFLSRAVRYLAHEQGIRQFLDIGAGLPMVDNTHEVAQRVARVPDRRQRSAGARARPGPAGQHAGRRVRLRRR